MSANLRVAYCCFVTNPQAKRSQVRPRVIMQSSNALILADMLSAPSTGILRFAFRFAAAFFILQWAYQATAATVVQRFYIDILTVRPSAAVLQLLAPSDQVVALGHRLLWPGGRLSLLRGCDGTEALFLLLAAFVAMRMDWRQRLWGMAAGTLLIYLLNQARIVGLYFAVRHDRETFDLLHGLLGPLFIITAATVFFAWWTQRHATAHPA